MKNRLHIFAKRNLHCSYVWRFRRARARKDVSVDFSTSFLLLWECGSLFWRCISGRRPWHCPRCLLLPWSVARYGLWWGHVDALHSIGRYSYPCAKYFFLTGWSLCREFLRNGADESPWVMVYLCISSGRCDYVLSALLYPSTIERLLAAKCRYWAAHKKHSEPKL